VSVPAGTQITSAIENRDKEIRGDLVEFIRGQRARVDISGPLPVAAANLPPSAPVQPVGFNVVTPQGALPTELPDGSSDTEVEPDASADTSSVTDVSGLSAAYNEDTDVRLILDHFANRQRSRNTGRHTIRKGSGRTHEFQFAGRYPLHQ
jgi:hypothetical protein